MLKIFLKKPSQKICDPNLAPKWDMKVLENHIEYIGLFTVFGKQGKPVARVPGRVVEWEHFPADVYLFNPPKQLRQNHEKGACLQLLKPNSRWFKLHWEKPARTFDESRAYVEQILSEFVYS